MSWGTNPFSNPGAFGLTQVADLDFSSGSYEFDYTVVWTKGDEPRFYWADDSGCSCPSPFEDFETIDSLQHGGYEPLKAHLKSRFDGQYSLHVKLADLEKVLADLSAIAGRWSR